MEILFLIIGIIAGVAIGFLVARNRTAALEARNTMLKEQAAAARTDMQAEHSRDLERLQQQHREALAEQDRRFNEMSRLLAEQAKTATDAMLKQRQQEWAAASNRDLGQIVTPLRETIENMKKAMTDNTVKQSSMTSEMKATMEAMMRHSQAAKESTDELTRVFKFGNKVQGSWGETVLNELLQAQGLTPGVHYDVQASMRDADGHAVKGGNGERLIPDVILHLDQQRDVIIDSKVSLSAFIDYVGETDPERRQQHLNAHVESLMRHVKELSRKNYKGYVQPPRVSVDYVIMFVPHSGALWTALNARPDLWRRAMEQNVFIADEQTLYAALRIVDLTWRQITQTQNHERVYALATEMLTRVGQFWTHYEVMGKNLQQAVASYENGRKKITDGGQSINTTARKLIDLGAKQSDTHPLPA